MLAHLLHFLGFRTFRHIVFHDEVVSLDYAEFYDCAFFGCEMRYDGGPLTMHRVRAEGCQWRFGGRAAAGIGVLEHLATTDPAFVLEALGLTHLEVL